MKQLGITYKHLRTATNPPGYFATDVSFLAALSRKEHKILSLNYYCPELNLDYDAW